jgi:signal transduction histidine kinase
LSRSLRPLRRVLIAIVIVVLPASVMAQVAGKAPRILLIHATDLLVPSTVEQDAITRKALTDSMQVPLEFYSIGFDELRSLGPPVEDDLIAVLLKQFSERPPDLIIFHGLMHRIFLRNRARLWPGVPVMFVGVATHRLADPQFPREIPTSTISFDLPGTVDLAMKLQPEARRLLLIAGTAAYDRSWQELAPRQLEGHRDRLDIELLAGRSLEELEKIVSALKSDTIVVFLSMYRDGSDRVYVMREVVQQLSDRASVPIYALNPYQIGTGALGGSVVNWAGQHGGIGDMGRRLLAGEPASAIRWPAPAPARCRIDWRLVERLHIPASRVPASCEIRFREPTFWVAYRTETILILLIVALQAAVIGLLLRQRHVRRQAQLQGERQRLELMHASRLSMVGELSASIAHEINQPLSAIHMNASVGEDLLGKANPPLSDLKEILGDIRRDDERASEVIKKLRELLQKRPIEMRPIDINEALSGVLQFLGVTARHREMFLKTDLASGLPQIRGDRVQLQQVVMNLVMNALEAMISNPPDRRTVTVRTREQPAGSIEVSVIDAGQGVAPEAVASVFDPFFTTKHEGMGLGLSISRNIVITHRGRIWVESDASGATFRFVIPVLVPLHDVTPAAS